LYTALPMLPQPKKPMAIFSMVFSF